MAVFLDDLGSRLVALGKLETQVGERRTERRACIRALPSRADQALDLAWRSRACPFGDLLLDFAESRVRTLYFGQRRQARGQSRVVSLEGGYDRQVMTADDGRMTKSRLGLAGDLLVSRVAMVPIQHPAIAPKLRHDCVPVAFEALASLALFLVLDQGNVGFVKAELGRQSSDDLVDLFAGRPFCWRDDVVPKAVLRIGQPGVGCTILKDVLAAAEDKDLLVFFAVKDMIG